MDFFTDKCWQKYVKNGRILSNTGIFLKCCKYRNIYISNNGEIRPERVYQWTVIIFSWKISSYKKVILSYDDKGFFFVILTEGLIAKINFGGL